MAFEREIVVSMDLATPTSNSRFLEAFKSRGRWQIEYNIICRPANLRFFFSGMQG